MRHAGDLAAELIVRDDRMEVGFPQRAERVSDSLHQLQASDLQASVQAYEAKLPRGLGYAACALACAVAGASGTLLWNWGARGWPEWLAVIVASVGLLTLPALGGWVWLRDRRDRAAVQLYCPHCQAEMINAFMLFPQRRGNVDQLLATGRCQTCQQPVLSTVIVAAEKPAGS